MKFMSPQNMFFILFCNDNYIVEQHMDSYVQS